MADVVCTLNTKAADRLAAGRMKKLAVEVLALSNRRRASE